MGRWSTDREPSIAGAVEATLERSPPPVLETRIFGTEDPDAIDALVSDFCRRQLGSSPRACLLFESGQAAVFGLELEDGREVAVKAFAPEQTEAFLSAMQTVQAHLHARWFPCPRPLVGPRPIGSGHAVVESLELDGSWADAHRPGVRREIASALARLLRLTGELPDGDALDLPASLAMRPRPGSVWPRPHHAIFDFEGTAQSAGWIDRLGERARVRLGGGAGRVVVGHQDWSVKDMRFVDDRLFVVYDWQSLCRDRETLVVGAAAATFTMQWRFEGPLAPTLDEMDAFVAEYEEARRMGFDRGERSAIGAAAALVLAYVARCEHAVDPEASSLPERSARHALADQGDELLRW